MKKIWILTAVLFVGVFAINSVSAQIWETNAPANFRMDIKKNQYASGYQWEGNAAWLLNGNKLEAGQKYELDITFTANRAIPLIDVVFVDAHPSVDYWKEVSIQNKDDTWAQIQNIAANTPVSTTLSFTIYHTPTSSSRQDQKLIFDSQEITRDVTLTFSKFTLRRVQ